jgi:hypothetical protein
MDDNIVGVIAVAGAMLIPIVAVIFGYWHKVRLAEYDAHLKRTMLERGMPSDEIERVLRAGRPPKKEHQ